MLVLLHERHSSSRFFIISTYDSMLQYHGYMCKFYLSDNFLKIIFLGFFYCFKFIITKVFQIYFGKSHTRVFIYAIFTNMIIS